MNIGKHINDTIHLLNYIGFVSMEKLICMVTGATDGIGKAVAKAIAQRGDTLLIVGRDINKTETVL